MDNDHATSCERTGERELNKNKVVNPRDSPERERERGESRGIDAFASYILDRNGRKERRRRRRRIE